MLRGFLRRCLAVVLSVLVAGSGQVFNRQPKKGLVILLLANVFFLFGAAVELFRTFPGFVVGVCFELSFLLWVAVDSAVYGGPKAKEGAGFSRQRLWYISAIILIAVNGIGAGTHFYENDLLGINTQVFPSNSMAPTLEVGDRFVSATHYYTKRLPQRGEVVVFRKDVPGKGTLDSVKRVIAIGSDTVAGRRDGVYLNGQLLDEPYAYHGSSSTEDPKRLFGPTAVAPGEYFLMGDNRADSWDSRYYGTVPRSDIESRLLYIYWSHDRSRIGQTIH